MSKSIIILKREYLTRVRKKSFMIMTMLIPLMMASMTLIPVWLATRNDSQERLIAVYDPAGQVVNELTDMGSTRFYFLSAEEYAGISKNFRSGKFYALLTIPEDLPQSQRADLISDKPIAFDVKNQITGRINWIVEAQKRRKVMADSGIPNLEAQLAATRTQINFETLKVDTKGESVKSSTEIAMVTGYLAGFLIYIFVFAYGTLVMRGVMEEKTSRIVEVIISSVKPFQLLFGKIIGIGLVGLTQIVIWIVLGGLLISGMSLLAGEKLPEQASPDKLTMILQLAGNMNIPLILFSLIFYFIGGFLLYASLMGAIGSAVDSDEDAQQLMLPVTMPLIFSIIILIAVAKNPEGSIAFWASMIPLTSPVTMMVRVPYGVPAWELLLSMSILITSILGTIWMAGKIYRTGILMYGKKVTIKEIVRWLFYKG